MLYYSSSIVCANFSGWKIPDSAGYIRATELRALEERFLAAFCLSLPNERNDWNCYTPGKLGLHYRGCSLPRPLLSACCPLPAALCLWSAPRMADVTIAIIAKPAITAQELWKDATKISCAFPHSV